MSWLEPSPSAARRALRRLAPALLALAVVATALPARATPVDPFNRERVIALLSADPFAPTLEDWKRIGPEANRILVDLAESPTLRPSLRLRAMAALAWFPSRRSRAFLMQRLYGRDVPVVEQRTAMRALALAFDDEVFHDLRGFLSNEDPLVREGAVRGLGLIRGERVRILLEHHLGIEKELWVRRAIEEELERLQRPRKDGVPALEPGSPARTGGGKGAKRR